MKHTATKAAIALFRAMRATKRGLERLLSGFFQTLHPVTHGVFKAIVLPTYQSILFIRMKAQRFMLPTRGFALFFVSNKYLFHGVLGLAAFSTILLNVQTQQANAQDVGKNSLLYALATDSDVEIVQENARIELPKDAAYLSEALVAIPHVDFDYTEDQDVQIADLSVPGAISAAPLPDNASGSSAPRTKTEVYVVKPGDTIGTIAQQFSVNVGTVLWNNGLGEKQYIRPGDSLKIPPVSGLIVAVKKGDTISKLAGRYQARADEILKFNRITDESSLALGTELIIPDGKPPATAQAIASAAKQSRARTSGASSEYVPANIPRPSDANSANLPVTKLLWPTPGRVITQYYGWKHTGLDIDGDFTSPLYAAYDGIVDKAGWNSGGYGLQVVVKHPNGMTTRYAHASKLFVKAGDQVKRGQVIAMMGSTGRSTGSHLHFEVYIKGVRTNPLAYIR